LSAGDQGDCLASTSKTYPATADALWTVEARGEAAKLPQAAQLRLRQGSLRFGPFRRDDGPNGTVRFHGQGGYLRIMDGNGAVDAIGPGGPLCQFRVEADGDFFRLQSAKEPYRHLGVTAWGALTGCEVEPAQRLFCVEPADFEGELPVPALIGPADFDENLDFTTEERRAFIRDGFIIVRSAVPSCLVAAALAQINSALMTPGSIIKDDAGLAQICPGARQHETVIALLRATPLWTYAQRLLGRGCVAPCNNAQLALRGPDLKGAPLKDGEMPPKVWHIDGMDKGKHSPFSVLLGVALSDQSQPNCGNLVAFRGSHHVLQPLLRTEVEAGSSLFSKEDWTGDKKPSFTDGEQILLQPGDAILLHQKVAHRVGVNLSPHIRYQTYFRLMHKNHAKNLETGALLDDLWTEFEGLAKDVADVAANVR